MPPPFLRTAILAITAMGLGACSTYGHDGYYGSAVSVGYNAGTYSPYYGWYDNFYYPGTGAYVWDRSGYRHAWSDRQRTYWTARRAGHRAYRDHWNDYRYERRGDYVRRDQRRYRDRQDVRRYREQRRDYREQRREYREQRRERIQRDRQRSRIERSERRARPDRSRVRSERFRTPRTVPRD